MDESTNQSDSAQLVIFIRGIDVNFNIIEEMLNNMKGTTTGRDILEYVNLSIEKFNIDKKITFLNNLSLVDITEILSKLNLYSQGK